MYYSQSARHPVKPGINSGLAFNTEYEKHYLFKKAKNMKYLKTGITALTVAFMLNTTAYAQKPGSLSISGTLTGLPDGTVLTLSEGATHKESKPFATTTVSKGKYKFNTSLQGPRLLLIGIKDQYTAIPVVASKGNVIANAEVKTQKSGDSNTYNFVNEKVSGSPENDLYLKKQAFRKALNQEYETNNKNYAALSKKMQEARGAKNQRALDSLGKSPDGLALAQAEKAFFTNVEKKISGAILADKNSWWGPLLMLTNFNFFTPDSRPLFDAMTPAAKETYYGKLLKNELYPPSLEGKQIPAFTLSKDQSQGQNINELLKGHKYTLIDFWASWCGPCRKSIPELKELYSKHKDKGFQIISISIDKKEADWKKAETEENLPWPSFLDRTKAADLFNVKAIPNLFLIDENGKVINVFTGAAGVTEKVNSLF